ncbi:glycine/D-amino acid oxidase-like deaminating enzyme [Novosphingobium capsulatum]|uniref:Glycine/D-amino acid oxidase-like deaminating enzyme n=1 Tax=Novosphingobium capsulatum TaxID=13688 RepID=A0ABU1MMY3_9SPHN|nr:FAD-dependent oxidoreductase [Novosphingobium capsulatum]MDR6511579.1 glycine/D-amino acid oxidase-like deaminating enzyme [Novosphingobium capsulatum]
MSQVRGGDTGRIQTIAGDHWISSAHDDLRLRRSLDGEVSVDIAILGGGFSGLWTAYHLLSGNPSLQVAIVERRFCGYGASGRNGGWCSPRFPVDPAPLIRRYGLQVARRVMEAQQDTVARFGETLAEAGIDAEFRHTGLLSIARGEKQHAYLQKTFATYEALGLNEGNRMLDAAEAFEQVHVTRLSGALHSTLGATVHPGKLVRGLANAVEALGAQIFEGTEATSVRRGGDAAICCKTGVVRARRAVVVAGEAYIPGLAGFRRDLLPMSSMIVLTEPLTPAQWEAVGWQGGECLSSQARTKNYLTRTCDDRILYGSRGAPYHFGSATRDEALREEAVFEWMRGTVREWWPALADIGFSNAWGGYLGVPRDWMPTVHFDPDSKLAVLYGYTGRGVSTSAMCARLAAGLVGGWQTGLEGLPFHRAAPRKWEVEPFRWGGVRYVQNALARMDAAEEQNRAMPIDAPLAEYLSAQ